MKEDRISNPEKLAEHTYYHHNSVDSGFFYDTLSVISYDLTE